MSGKACLKVIGVGGGGSNAVNRMIYSQIKNVEFIAMNTDVQALEQSNADAKIRLGINLTRGLGAGGNPEIGRHAAEESKAEIRRILEGSDMVFITAGMGGGTGTGAAPIIAEMAKDMGILTVAIVTSPFLFEGGKRFKLAEQGINTLMNNVDTIITIPNEKLIDLAEKGVTLEDAFRLADDVLRQGVQSISDIITITGSINVDFADVRAVMKDAGPALVGIGTGTGEKRALDAAKIAISNLLLENTIHGAKGLLVNVTGNKDITLAETTEAVQYISNFCDKEEANIYFGIVIDNELGSEVRMSVLATGFAPSAHKNVNTNLEHQENFLTHNKALSGLNIPNFIQSSTYAIAEPGNSIKEEDLDLPKFLRGMQHGN